MVYKERNHLQELSRAELAALLREDALREDTDPEALLSMARCYGEKAQDVPTGTPEQAYARFRSQWQVKRKLTLFRTAAKVAVCAAMLLIVSFLIAPSLKPAVNSIPYDDYKMSITWERNGVRIEAYLSAEATARLSETLDRMTPDALLEAYTLESVHTNYEYGVASRTYRAKDGSGGYLNFSCSSAGYGTEEHRHVGYYRQTADYSGGRGECEVLELGGHQIYLHLDHRNRAKCFWYDNGVLCDISTSLSADELKAYLYELF